MSKMKNIKLSKGAHQHCDKCYDAHCRAPVQIPVSCLVVTCRNHCGFTFHMCKEEEHQLLCPKVTVPCLNVLYGCPLMMLRHKQAEHLEVCPASIVCCSQEWNRWPVSETDMTFYKNVSDACHTEKHLDVAVALRDQDLLFQTIKMKNIFPELMMEEQDVTGVKCADEEAACSRNCVESTGNSNTGLEKTESGQEEEEEDLSPNVDEERTQNFSSWNKVFTKELGGCTETAKNMNTKEVKRKQHDDQQTANCQVIVRKSHQDQENTAAASNMEGATGFAPWQDGVLERLGKQVHIADYNMYLVHHGAMLINFGQLAACTPREKDFVYGSLEPIEVKTVRTFNVPTSYRAKRIHLKDPGQKAETRNQSVDTRDMGLSVEDLPKCDEVSATLLCALENEFKGHVISESVGVDGLYVNVGTQTYNFKSAPFRTDVSLADIMMDKPPCLYMHLEAEPVTRRHNRRSSSFSYVCGHFFRRDEFRSHYRNVHSDIQASLHGWLQQRCPLAYLGCTFTQRRLQPGGQPTTIKFCPDVNTFVLQPQVPSALCDNGKTINPQRNGVRNLDPLSKLPLEILQHIATFLDSFTLSQLAQVSHLMRDLCAMLLQERGMVSLKWEKKKYSHGKTSWRCRKKASILSCLPSKC